MQITIDNNIIPRIRSLGDNSTAKKIQCLINTEELVVHLNEAHFIELLKLRKYYGIFKSHCETLLQIFNGKVLKVFSEVIKEEYEGRPVNRFFGDELKQNIQIILRDVSNSDSLENNFDDHINVHMTDFYDYNDAFNMGQRNNLLKTFSDIKKAINEGKFSKDDLTNFKNKGFEYYYSLKDDEKYQSALNFCLSNNIAVKESSLRNAIDNIDFPFLNTFLRSRYAMHYNYICNYQREFDENDIIDNRYIINSINLDYLVSDDKGLQNIATLACPKLLKVITTDEFFRIIDRT